MERQISAGVFWRGARDFKDLGLPSAAQFDSKVGLRLDKDASPARLFQEPGLRALARVVSSDLDEIALDIAEERANQPHLMIGRVTRQEQFSQRDERVFELRVRSTIDVVE